MNKNILFISSFFLLTGCSFGVYNNTPKNENAREEKTIIEEPVKEVDCFGQKCKAVNFKQTNSMFIGIE